jgi:hypothetical protein
VSEIVEERLGTKDEAWIEARQKRLAPVLFILSSLSASVLDLRSVELMDRLREGQGVSAPL